MPALVSVVGASNAGKTTVIEALLPLLVQREVRVGAIKHTHHGFDFDRPGADSARYAEAGAAPVLVVGPEGGMLLSPGIRRGQPGDDVLPALAGRYFTECDLVLVEGFSSEPGPKILVRRSDIEQREDIDSSEVIAAVTDVPLGYPLEVRPDTLEPLVDLLAEHARANAEYGVSLVVDNRRVPLTEFVSSFVAATFTGMLRALKDVPEVPSSLDLTIRRR